MKKQYRRELVDRWSFRGANTKEYTHCYHIYPAMMIPQVARCLIEEFRPEGRCDRLFDPYCGSGTSLVEATLKGMQAIGFDLNPLARMIARVKTTRFDAESILRDYEQIRQRIACYTEERVLLRHFDHISNAAYWYSEPVLLQLSYLSQLINEVPKERADFFKVALSEVVREASFTRNNEFKRFRMPKEQIQQFHPDVFGLFAAKVVRNIEGLEAFNAAITASCVMICDCDSSKWIDEQVVADDSVDMVVTSPPYGDSRTTVAYGQFSRWANEWFSFAHAQNLDRLLMGGGKADHETFATATIRSELDRIQSLDAERYGEVVAFLNDYTASIGQVARKVRSGGVVCYVVGNRNVKGVQIPLDYFTAEQFELLGFEHQRTIVRTIPNKRMPAQTSPTNRRGEKVGTMKYEYIVILKRR